MDKSKVFMGLIIVIIMALMVNPFIEQWNIGWEKDKEDICLPYHLDGIVKVYEGIEHCSEEEILEKQSFTEYYCKDKMFCGISGQKKVLRAYYTWSNGTGELNDALLGEEE